MPTGRVHRLVLILRNISSSCARSAKLRGSRGDGVEVHNLVPAVMPMARGEVGTGVRVHHDHWPLDSAQDQVEPPEKIGRTMSRGATRGDSTSAQTFLRTVFQLSIVTLGAGCGGIRSTSPPGRLPAWALEPAPPISRPTPSCKDCAFCRSAGYEWVAQNSR